MSMAKQITLLDSVYRASGVEQWRRLGKGLPAPVFPALATMFGLSATLFATCLDLEARTLRNRTALLTPSEAERSFRAYRVFRKATEVLGGEDEARQWLGSPKTALGGKKPIELLSRDVGAEEVHNLLGAIEEGVYT